MSVWLLPLAVAGALLLVGLPLLVWQVIRAATAGSTEVEILGIKVKSPYVSIVLVIVGAGFVWFSAERLAEESRVQIVDAKVSVDGRFGPDVLYWHTPCPATVEVTGVISATGRGTVTYEFIRQIGIDGQETPTHTATLDFTEAGSRIVVDQVVVPFPVGTYYYSDVLHIVGPTERRSEPVGFTVWCDPDTEPAPPGMPPPPSVGPITP